MKRHYKALSQFVVRYVANQKKTGLYKTINTAKEKIKVMCNIANNCNGNLWCIWRKK
jgi:hypothetical protein